MAERFMIQTVVEEWFLLYPHNAALSGGGPFFQGKLGSNVNLHMENNHFSKMGIGHSKFPSPETFQFLNPLITSRRPKLYKRSYRISWK